VSGSKQAVVIYVFDSGKCVQNIKTQLTDYLNVVSQCLNVGRSTLDTTKTKTMLFGAQQNLSKVDGGFQLIIGGISSTGQMLQVRGPLV